MSYQAGIYFFRPEHLGVGESKNKTPYLWIEGTPEQVAQNGEWVPVENPQKRTIFVYLSDKSIAVSRDKLDSIGFNGDFANPNLTGDFINGFNATCEYETYEGKQKERWNIAGTGGGIEHTALDREGVRRLNALWKAKGGPKGPPNKPKPPAQKPVVPAADGEMPPPTEDD